MELVQFLLRTGTVPRPEIIEWTPVRFSSVPGILYLGLVLIGAISLIRSQRPRKPAAVLILVLTAILPLIAHRHYPLFALSLVVLGGVHIADAWNQWRPLGSPSVEESTPATALVSFMSVLLIGISLPRFGCIRIEPIYFPYPARAVAFLNQSRFHGNMVVPFDWGEYVIWHLGPEVKVSIDGRRETVYSDQSYRQSLDLARGSGAWDALLKTGSPTDLILIPKRWPVVVPLSRMTGWISLYQDSYCIIFAREGLPDLDRIVQTPVPTLPDNGNRVCFPAPGKRSAAGGKGRKPAEVP